MKVELQLEVSQQQFFDLITTSIMNEIKQATGKEIRVDEINQYQYTKSMTTKLGVTNSVDVLISNFTPPTLYEANVMSPTGKYIFQYDIEAVDSSHCFVRYEETYHSDKWNLKLNYSIFSFFYMKASKKRLIASIRHMEQLILHPELMAQQAQDDDKIEDDVDTLVS